ncbi:MAG: HlyC/CorC family transporter [Actinobacteria bacterium]|jgi:putative hemolysin|nr:HlyC/CorC family transporter [Actinomycetota bacterium]NCW43021.1 HlyC/CorC family transporter [Actinomycetota bacterium]NCW71564.1 HlyC/CorC family transporter [Actinomycetota bacterium]NCW92487.1 HlyC/CorC family transporter [Actinomycetota bacterium]NCX36897.1 HlyC/CorC family transporter [Actinomycetota bacterium]
METHSVGTLLTDLALIAGLIVLASFFVAAEIALISLRDSQVREIATRGKRGARVAALAAHPNRLLAAVQIGVTVSGFLSAALGADQLGDYVIPWLESQGISNTWSTTISLLGVTLVIAYFSLVFGELVPKRVALFRAEEIAMATAGIINVVANIFRPLIWLLSKSTDFILRIFGIDPKEARSQISEEELLDLVSGHAALSDEERDIVEEVFNASERQIHEIMVPRTEVDFMDVSLTVGKAIDLAVDKAHSRYPVIRGSSDEVIGFIHVRDLLDTSLATQETKIIELVRSIIFLPGTKGILPALSEMRKQGQHVAIVLDEYGGTDGIVTLEDLVECLIGDIRDEFDEDESEVAIESRTGDFEVDGLISIEDLIEQTGLEIPDGPYETASGFVMHHLGRIPKDHDVLVVDGVRVTVLSMEGKRAGMLLISRNA